MRQIWLALAAVASLTAGLASAAGAIEVPLSPDDRILGKADAPITIVEYASLTCPHCAAFARDTLPKIKAEWIDPGKAKLVFRDFPLDGSAVKASVLARCAPPDKFYGFIDVLFSSQESWARNPDPTPGLARIAKLGGMSEEQLNACMADNALQDRVLASRLTAEKEYKVESTPTFFINGTKLTGALPYEQFDEALKKAASAQ